MSFFGWGSCTAKELESAKQKTLMLQNAIENMNDRRKQVLAKTPDAIIHIFRDSCSITFQASERNTYVVIAKETYMY